MIGPTVHGVPHRSAAAVGATIDFRGSGRALLRDDLTPRQFFDLLVEKEEFEDAIRFLAHALPKRAAVWWGCLCLWQESRPEPVAPVRAAIEAAVRWVLEPSDDNRRTADAPARAAGIDTAAGCLAKAVFWSGGSLLPPHLPPVLPKPFLTAKAVAGAVLLAAAHSGTADVRRLRRREFLTIGREVAGGKNRWTVPAGTVPALERGPDW